MKSFLSKFRSQILLKDFGSYAERTTKAVVDESRASARESGREVRYLESSRTPKEDVARESRIATAFRRG